MKPTYIVIHHSHTDDSETASWPVIRKNHLANGWRDIGYHYGIEDLRGTHEILVGRFDNEPGAHCTHQDMNNKGIGVCLIGNFDEYPPSREIWEKAVKLTRYLCDKYKIPFDNVIGHRETMAPKSCPGVFFNMDHFREALYG